MTWSRLIVQRLPEYETALLIIRKDLPSYMKNLNRKNSNFLQTVIWSLIERFG